MSVPFAVRESDQKLSQRSSSEWLFEAGKSGKNSHNKNTIKTDRERQTAKRMSLSGPKEEKRARDYLSTVVPKIVKNELEIEERGTDEKFPILEAEDLILWPLVKAHVKCALCYLHGQNTPCGPQLNKWQDCVVGDMMANATPEEKDERCKEIFEKEFFPCFAPIGGSEYYRIRTNLLYATPYDQLMNYWFKAQKHRTLSQIYNKYQMEE